jgi:Arc/MetJ-type ribon-helix-helix transcriptional regulator
MASSKIGKPTGKVTKAGRPVYKTPEGEEVSEKSVTISMNGKWVNAPSIWNGKRIDEDGVERLLKEGAIKPTSVHDTLEEAVKAAEKRSSELNTGGYMKAKQQTQNKKMQMGGMTLPQERKPMYSSTMTTPEGSLSDIDTGGVVAVPGEEVRASTTTSPTELMRMPPGMAKGGMLQEGGLLQEGGTVDPASGNEVPTGSLQEEVRDDIPAQLSEGEFVFPADVVRFIGLERLMKMRQAAKEGLQKMNDMGQMGNAEEATMDDGADTEFETEIDDILAEVEREGQQA